MRTIWKMLMLAVALPACIGVDELEDTVVAIVIAAAPASIEIGDSLALEARLRNTFGDEFEGDVEWQSSAPGIAAVSAGGILRGLAPGQARITASNDSLTSAELFVTVIADPDDVAEVTVLIGDPLLSPGDSVQATAAARNAAGDLIPGLAFTWTSSDPAVATVDAQGWIRAISNGNAQIQAAVQGVLSTPVAVSVGAQPRSGIFAGLNGYMVRGGVTLLPASGGVTIRMESDFQSSSGPGLYVYLSNSATSVSGGLEVAKLRKTSGIDTYEVPGVSLTQYSHVFIHCKPFNIPFGAARLQ